LSLGIIHFSNDDCNNDSEEWPISFLFLFELGGKKYFKLVVGLYSDGTALCTKAHINVRKFRTDWSCFVPNNEYFLQGFVVKDALYFVVLFTSLTCF